MAGVRVYELYLDTGYVVGDRNGDEAVRALVRAVAEADPGLGEMLLTDPESSGFALALPRMGQLRQVLEIGVREGILLPEVMETVRRGHSLAERTTWGGDERTDPKQPVLPLGLRGFESDRVVGGVSLGGGYFGETDPAETIDGLGVWVRERLSGAGMDDIEVRVGRWGPGTETSDEVLLVADTPTRLSEASVALGLAEMSNPELHAQFMRERAARRAARGSTWVLGKGPYGWDAEGVLPERLGDGARISTGHALEERLVGVDPVRGARVEVRTGTRDALIRGPHDDVVWALRQFGLQDLVRREKRRH